MGLFTYPNHSPSFSRLSYRYHTSTNISSSLRGSHLSVTSNWSNLSDSCLPILKFTFPHLLPYTTVCHLFSSLPKAQISPASHLLARLPFQFISSDCILQTATTRTTTNHNNNNNNIINTNNKAKQQQELRRTSHNTTTRKGPHPSSN